MNIRSTRRLSPIALVMICGLAAGGAMDVRNGCGLARATTPLSVAMGSESAQADTVLPIRSITLYRSGVGYFERGGLIDGNAQLQLRFNTDQINDILKSMVLLDLSGGRIDSVSYGSKEPLAKRLASFGINIADNPSASEILQRLRGTNVKLSLPEGQFSGTIMNVETRPTVYQGSAGTTGASGASVHQLPWINLVTGDGVKSFNLANVTGFEILDKDLAAELNKALAALAEYRADRTKTVDLRFSGAGSRKVVVGYVHEMPVWKTSYRLVLPDADAKDGKGQVLLQGWAIVENTTDQDWKDVQLNLVSGRPVSFQMDLYEPLFMTRPWVEVPTIPGVMPRGYALGADMGEAKREVEMASQSYDEMSRNVGRAGVRGAPSAKSGMSAAAPPPPPAEPKNTLFYYSTQDLASYAPQPRASAAEVGEVFQYRVDQPVSIERQRSAMIPILTTNITGRRVSIFSAADGQPYPRRGVEIKNDAKIQLLAGPISVIDGGGEKDAPATYAGDAQLGQVPKGDKRLLSYALDLNVNVTTKDDQTSNVTKLKIVDGLFEQTNKRVASTSYEFANRDSNRGRTIIVEHPRFMNWTLVEPSKPTEQTPDLYRFEINADAGKNTKLTVTQEIIESQQFAVTNYDLNQILAFHKDGKLSDAVVKAVREVATRQAEIARIERDVRLFDTQTSDITSEQSRIRSNMNTIERNSPLYAKYMTKLTEQETKLEEITKAKGASQDNLIELRNKLAEYLRTLNVD